MSENRIHSILFDFGGVLAEEGFRNGLLALAAEQKLNVEQMPEQATQAVYDSGFILGRGTAADFWTLLGKRTGLKGKDTALSKRILDGFIIRTWMLELVKRLCAEGYLTGILSDQTHWLDELDRRYHFYQAFDHVYNSYYLGKGKQDVTLFADVASDLNLKPGEILFIDDDVANVARAQQAGMQTIQYVDKESFTLALESMLAKNTQPA